MNHEEEEEIIKKLGKRIKELRLAKGYSNYENFAHDIDVHRAQYSKYEMGQNMKFLSLLKVVEGLGVSMEEFFKDWDSDSKK
ncbi:MAG: helix-turn-helix transcriptional regulator [Marinoscillum sp.]